MRTIKYATTNNLRGHSAIDLRGATNMSPDGPSLHTTLDGHGAAVTAMEFSPDGRFLASAGDDGVVLVFSTLSWAPVCRFVDVSPVSVLRWHRKKEKLLFCGHRNGDLHVLTMSKSMVLIRHRAHAVPLTIHQTETHCRPDFEFWGMHLFPLPLANITPCRRCLRERGRSNRFNLKSVSFEG